MTTRIVMMLTLALFVAPLGCGLSETIPATPGPNPGSSVMEAMRDGTWNGRKFPTLDWADVGPLLSYADSDEILTAFPVNPFSSQSQSTCSVGILALWLIEGVRCDNPGGFPSLNPLCLGGDSPETDWIAISESNRPAAAVAYRRWWKEHGDASLEARQAANPLAGTGLNWHGGFAGRRQSSP